MTIPTELLSLVEAILADIEHGTLSDESIQALHRIFQNTLIAALDLIDRSCVIRWKTPWGRVSFEVRGSTQTYTVYPPMASPSKALKCREAGTVDASQIGFCPCPAFAFYVLKTQTQLMCKHILALRLADRLNKFWDRQRTEEELVTAALAASSIS